LLRGRIDYRFVNGDSAALFPDHRALVLLTPQAGQMATWYSDFAPVKTVRAADGYRLVRLDGSWPGARFEPVAGPRLFQNGVEIQGYLFAGGQASAYTGGQAPAFAGEQGAATEPLRVWLLWQVLWRTPEDNHFYVQLLDAGSQVLGQKDAPGYPNAYRRPGDRIVSQFDIKNQQGDTVEPIWLRAGLYVYPAVKAISIVDSSGNPIGDVVLMGPLDGGT
jgi:hypothetical protein